MSSRVPWKRLQSHSGSIQNREEHQHWAVNQPSVFLLQQEASQETFIKVERTKDQPINHMLGEKFTKAET